VNFGYTPANFDPAGLDPVVDLFVGLRTCGFFLDSDTLAVNGACGPNLPTPVVRSQPSGPDVVILPVRSLTVDVSGDISIRGSRPVIFAVFGDAYVSGQLDATAAGNQQCAAGTGGVGANGTRADGGGGGGHLIDGAKGGGTTNNGGLAHGTASLVPIFTGCRGGQGGASLNLPTGGSAGGALQISAAGKLTLFRADVRARGGTGFAGDFRVIQVDGTRGASGGGGGGSGGSIVLEGDNVSIALSRLDTLGGTGGDGGGGSPGGAGGGISPPQIGGKLANNGGAGGGGSAGRVRIHGATSCSATGTFVPAVTCQ